MVRDGIPERENWFAAKFGNKWKSIDQWSCEKNMYIKFKLKPKEFTGLTLWSGEEETFEEKETDKKKTHTHTHKKSLLYPLFPK